MRRNESVCMLLAVRTQLSSKTRLPQHICGENWLSRLHPTHTASVGSSCCLELFFKERIINSKFRQRRLVELRGALLAPSAVIKKCCQWCSACVTTLERHPHSARKHSSLPNDANPRTRLVHRPNRSSLSMVKRKRNKNSISDTWIFFRHPNCFRKRGCSLCAVYLCPALRKVRRDHWRNSSGLQRAAFELANSTQIFVVCGKTADTHQQKRSITTCSRFNLEPNAKRRNKLPGDGFASRLPSFYELSSITTFSSTQSVSQKASRDGERHSLHAATFAWETNSQRMMASRVLAILTSRNSFFLK